MKKAPTEKTPAERAAERDKRAEEARQQVLAEMAAKIRSRLLLDGKLEREQVDTEQVKRALVLAAGDLSEVYEQMSAGAAVAPLIRATEMMAANVNMMLEGTPREMVCGIIDHRQEAAEAAAQAAANGSANPDGPRIVT